MHKTVSENIFNTNKEIETGKRASTNSGTKKYYSKQRFCMNNYNNNDPFMS